VCFVVGAASPAITTVGRCSFLLRGRVRLPQCPGPSTFHQSPCPRNGGRACVEDFAYRPRYPDERGSNKTGQNTIDATRLKLVCAGIRLEIMFTQHCRIDPNRKKTWRVAGARILRFELLKNTHRSRPKRLRQQFRRVFVFGLGKGLPGKNRKTCQIKVPTAYNSAPARNGRR